MTTEIYFRGRSGRCGRCFVRGSIRGKRLNRELKHKRAMATSGDSSNKAGTIMFIVNYFSMAAAILGSVASTLGSKTATSSPFSLSRYFWKSHLTSVSFSLLYFFWVSH